MKYIAFRRHNKQKTLVQMPGLFEFEHASVLRCSCHFLESMVFFDDDASKKNNAIHFMFSMQLQSSYLKTENLNLEKISFTEERQSHEHGSFI